MATVTETVKKNPLEIVKASKIEGVESEEVIKKDVDKIVPLATDMMSLCAAEGGVGLSAIQVGINKQIFVWMTNDTTFEIAINPTFYPEKKKTHAVEGCLSYPGEHYYLERYKRVRAIYYSLNDKEEFVKVTKNLSGINAIVFQHEVDHLRGMTIKMKGELLKKDKDARYKLANEQ